MSCCADTGLSEIFTDEAARRDAERYRRRGLDARAKRLLNLIHATTDLRGRATLEIGAGVGAFSIELVRTGAARAAGVDATAAAVQQARTLASERNLSDRIDFTIGDWTELAAQIPPADIVVLDRVVCCFPDWRALLVPALQHATSMIVLSYPAERRMTRIGINTVNAFQKLRKRRFRVHLHPPQEMHALLRDHGFDLARVDSYWMWELAVAVRRPPTIG